MMIVIVGGTGLIGSKMVTRLRGNGHTVVQASPSKGVNTVTGEGLAEALTGAQVVVDVANAPSFEDQAVMEFFQTSSRNLAAAEKAADVRHHIVLSVVGAERLQASGYFKGKLAQEALVIKAGIPYTIVRATQFFEFLDSITSSATVGQQVRLSPAAIQPMSARDVADFVSDIALGSPLNHTIEIGGPERLPLTDFINQLLSARNDTREIVADPNARYFGVELNDDSLVPDANARRGAETLKSWLAAATADRPVSGH